MIIILIQEQQIPRIQEERKKIYRMPQKKNISREESIIPISGTPANTGASTHTPIKTRGTLPTPTDKPVARCLLFPDETYVIETNVCENVE